MSEPDAPEGYFHLPGGGAIMQTQTWCPRCGHPHEPIPGFFMRVCKECGEPGFTSTPPPPKPELSRSQRFRNWMMS